MSARVRSFWLDDALIDNIDALALKLHTTRSSLVREALQKLLVPICEDPDGTISCPR